MDLAHRALEAGDPGAVLHAEAGVLVRLRAGISQAALVFLPQQLQGDAGALEFLVDEGEVGFELGAGARHGWAIQACFQGRIVQGLGHRPVHAGGAGLQDDAVDGRLGDAQNTRALAHAQVGLQVQSKGLT